MKKTKWNLSKETRKNAPFRVDEWTDEKSPNTLARALIPEIESLRLAIRHGDQRRVLCSQLDTHGALEDQMCQHKQACNEEHGKKARGHQHGSTIPSKVVVVLAADIALEVKKLEIEI